MKSDNNQKSTGFLQHLGSCMGAKKPFIYLSLFLSGIGHIVALFPFVMLWLIVQILFEQGLGADISRISGLAWWALGGVIFYITLYFFALMLSHVAAFRVERNLRYSSMQRALAMPLGFYDKESTGKLKKVLDENAGLIHTFTAHQLPDLAGAITCLLTLFVLMAVIDWRMGLICLIPITITLAAFARMMGSKQYQSSMSKYLNHIELMNNEAVEYVRGISVVKAFGQSVYSFNRFLKTIKDYQTWVVKHCETSKWPMSIIMVAANSFSFFLLPFAVLLIYRGASVVEILPNLIFYVLITPFFTSSIMRLMFLVWGQRQAGESLKRIDNLFAGEEPIQGEKAFNGENYSISLQDVSFAYNEGAALAIDNITLNIPHGKRYALVGASGCGKTTLARLIARFRDPSSGHIYIGENMLAELAPESIADKVSFVFQNEKLFKISIRDNITYGSPHATDEEVKYAVEMAQCQDIIDKLPNGLDTLIGAKGIYLSGGEQQRVALARAFLKNAPILLLDEATAFADPENESAIQSVLRELMQGKTVVIIAHRLSSVVDVDQIVVMDEGKIVEQGTHKELLEQGRLYPIMWNEYQQATEWTLTV